MREQLMILLASVIFVACNSTSIATDHSDDAKYVISFSELLSTDGQKKLYRYWVKYPEAKHGHTRFIILPATVNFKPSTDFFSFSDTLYGFNIIGWSGDTVQSICITPSQEPPQKLIPYKQEIKKVKDNYWKQDYYFANSFGGTTEKYFDSITYSQNDVKFVGRDTSLGHVQAFSISAKKGQVEVPLGDSIFHVSRLEALTTIDGRYNEDDTIRRPPLVSLASYLLRPKKQVDWKTLKKFGVFVERPFIK